MSTSTSQIPSGQGVKKRKAFGTPTRASKRGRTAVTSKMVSAIAKRAVAGTFEKKFQNTFFSDTVGVAGNFLDITTITQGDAYFERVGQHLDIKDIMLRMQFDCSNAATSTYCRVLVFRWWIDNAVAAPSLAGLFEDTGNSVWQSNYKHDIREFTVLYDKAVALDPAGNQMKILNVLLRNNLKTKVGYAAAANTGTNHVYVLVMSDEATNVPTITYHAGVRYTDG